jgi:hypothetical protein
VPSVAEGGHAAWCLLLAAAHMLKSVC